MAVADHDVGATPFLASNRGQRFCYCFRSSCSPVLVRRDCRRGRYSRSLLLPYPLYPRHRSGFSDPSFESWGETDLLHERHILLTVGGS
jgi:hypothetical protein